MRFLTSEVRYPEPRSSRSTPEQVVPSQVNDTAARCGPVGDEPTLNFACTQPFMPFCDNSGTLPTFHNARFFSVHLKNITSKSKLITTTMLKSAQLCAGNQTHKKFAARKFCNDETQQNSTAHVNYHFPGGLHCILLTSPLTGTCMTTFDNGRGENTAALL